MIIPKEMAARVGIIMKAGDSIYAAELEPARFAAAHGVTAADFGPRDDSELIRIRLQEWKLGLHPDEPFQDWLAERVVASSVRLDRCRLEEDAWRGRQARRATGGAWEVDRRAEVERLAAGLAK